MSKTKIDIDFINSMFAEVNNLNAEQIAIAKKSLMGNLICQWSELALYYSLLTIPDKKEYTDPVFVKLEQFRLLEQLADKLEKFTKQLKEQRKLARSTICIPLVEKDGSELVTTSRYNFFLSRESVRYPIEGVDYLGISEKYELGYKPYIKQTDKAKLFKGLANKTMSIHICSECSELINKNVYYKPKHNCEQKGDIVEFKVYNEYNDYSIQITKHKGE